MTTRTLRSLIAVALVLSAGSRLHAAGLSLTGVNLAGAEFGSTLPGTYGQTYIYPNQSEVDYFMGKGMNVFRVPFRWERLQPSLGAAFDSAEFNRLNTFVQQTTAKGAKVILDPHNYARYNGTVVGTGSVSNASFGDLWSRLASQYKSNTNVIFGLVNEPYGMPSTEHWVSTANAAISAIRNAGAQNLVLVPGGNAWTGAYSWNQNWYGTPNGVAMKNIVDPGNNFAFEVHQYLDSDSSGTSDTIVSPTIGAERLASFTQWMKTNGYRGFLGEFAVSNAKVGNGAEQIGDEALNNMFNYMESNADVWMGWSWWAAGPWWGDYMFSVEPTNLGRANQTDRPAMAILASHAAVPEPTTFGTIFGFVAMAASCRRNRQLTLTAPCSTSRLQRPTVPNLVTSSRTLPFHVDLGANVCTDL